MVTTEHDDVIGRHGEEEAGQLKSSQLVPRGAVKKGGMRVKTTPPTPRSAPVCKQQNSHDDLYNI